MAELKDLKNMTLRALRELARSVVGPGHPNLETRSELIEAITAAMGRKRPAAAPGAEERPAADAGDEHAWEQGPGSPGSAREPRPEGFFVSRVRGEKAAHDAPHALTEDRLAEPGALDEELEAEAAAEEALAEAPAAPAYDEGLGELPWSYGDDALIVLPRDPYTLWVYWDYAHHTVQEAMRGLENPHARMRVFEQGRLVRELDFALESRSFYINELAPGRHYRVELFFYGTNGGQNRIGKPSNTIGLPPRGPSPVLDDRFVMLSWGMPLSRRHDLFSRAQAEAGFSGEERDALHSASAGRPLGASENLPPGVPGGGSSSARPWSGTRYEGA
ncbi:DUF4912 domain-containing protein [Vulgatibacter sp.]|uniref:DUF4912 domain-containing protein n=1 Tax=Vulgatibacter sp. TaxID=1971226 RepID=UPI00356B2316